METSLRVRTGIREIRDLLVRDTHDVRDLGPGSFRAWLGLHMARWAQDEEWVQRARIRDLRRAHPVIRVLEERERTARAAYEAAPEFVEMEQVEREMADAGKAIAGLAGALEGAAPDEGPRLKSKLGEFRARRARLEERRSALAASCEPRRELDAARAELAGVREATGLARLEAGLAQIQRERGQRATRSGARFEDVARAAVERWIVPGLGSGGDEGRAVRVLRGVTLGAARTEIDQLVVRAPGGPNEPVEVLALVEAKRNLNDLAHGFRQRQENLAWLTGERGRYDPAEYRTRGFPSGHFDRAALHTEVGERYHLAPESFRRFHRDPATGFFLDGLYLVTRPGPVWGLGSGALARIAPRIATDESPELESEAGLRELLRWCQSLASSLETPDVLRLYGADERRAGQILLVEDAGASLAAAEDDTALAGSP